MNRDIMIQLLAQNWVQIVTGVLLPLAVGAVTKLQSHPFVYTVANFLLSLVAGVMEAIVANGGTINMEQITAYVLGIFTTSHLAYKMVWKPLGDGRADPVRLATPNIGVSAPPTTHRPAA